MSTSTNTQIIPTTYIQALEALLASEKQKIILEAERDLAITTRSRIQDRMVASALATASVNAREVKRLTKENEQLRTQIEELHDRIGIGRHWLTISCKNKEWKSLYGHYPSWKRLMAHSKAVGIAPKKDVEEQIETSPGFFQTVISYRYPVEAWELYRQEEERILSHFV